MVAGLFANRMPWWLDTAAKTSSMVAGLFTTYNSASESGKAHRQYHDYMPCVVVVFHGDKSEIELSLSTIVMTACPVSCINFGEAYGPYQPWE